MLVGSLPYFDGCGTFTPYCDGCETSPDERQNSWYIEQMLHTYGEDLW